MSNVKVVTTLILLSFEYLQECNSQTGTLWTPTKIGELRFMESSQTHDTSPATNWYHVGVLCAMRQWCHTFCLNYNGSSHLLSLLSVPVNEDPRGPPWIDCYTDRPRANFLTAQSGIRVYSATATYADAPQRVISNLLDGVAASIDDCYASSKNSTVRPHIVFDLGTVRHVRNASIFSQPNEFGAMYFKGLDIRVGMNPAVANFAQKGYKQLGYYEGPVATAAFEFHTNSLEAIYGQYVSITSNMSDMLQIYHVELY